MNSLYRLYELKFYLNAEHYIIIGNKKGDRHPHTWEFSLEFALPRNDFVEFSTVEREIQNYLKPYQNHLMNEIKPFDTLLPTVENMTDYFAKEFEKKIVAFDGILLKVKNSETPTRTYIVDLTDETQTASSKMLSQAIDHAIDEMVRDDG